MKTNPIKLGGKTGPQPAPIKITKRYTRGRPYWLHHQFGYARGPLAKMQRRINDKIKSTNLAKPNWGSEFSIAGVGYGFKRNTPEKTRPIIKWRYGVYGYLTWEELLKELTCFGKC